MRDAPSRDAAIAIEPWPGAIGDGPSAAAHRPGGARRAAVHLRLARRG